MLELREIAKTLKIPRQSIMKKLDFIEAIKIWERAKELEIPGISLMSKVDLAKAIESREMEIEIVCQQCLNEQRKAKIINGNMYNKKTMDNFIRALVCDYCEHSEFYHDGDIIFCVKCGATQPEDIGNDYIHKNQHL